MSKHYLAPLLSTSGVTASKWLSILAMLFASTSASAQTPLPEAYSIFNELPTQTSNLGFGTGSSTVIRSGTTSGLIDLSINSDVVNGSLTNSWAGSASGSIQARIIVNVYSSRATTKTSSGSLIFGNETTGLVGSALSLLTDVSAFMTHTASKQIAVTNSIATTGGSQRFAYNFDLAINAGLLGLSNLGVLDSLHVSAYSGGTAIATASVFSQVLGLTSITNTNFNDARFIFDYNPASGPLEIRWSSNVSLNAGLLGVLNEGRAGTNNIYTITDGSFGYLTPIPEPSSLILCALSMGLLLRRKR